MKSGLPIGKLAMDFRYSYLSNIHSLCFLKSLIERCIPLYKSVRIYIFLLIPIVSQCFLKHHTIASILIRIDFILIRFFCLLCLRSVFIISKVLRKTIISVKYIASFALMRSYTACRRICKPWLQVLQTAWETVSLISIKGDFFLFIRCLI